MSSRNRRPPPEADVIASDLAGEIVPREAVEWVGTREQLEAEGLVPPEILWPDRDRWTGWTRGPFEYWLRRTCPHSMRWPKRLALDCDGWALRKLVADRGKRHFPAAMRERRLELEKLCRHPGDQVREQAEGWRKGAAEQRRPVFKRHAIFD